MKARIVVLTVLGSVWFEPISLAAGTYLGVSGICAVQKCTRDLASGDTPPAMFHVMVRSGQAPDVVTPVLLRDLGDYLAANPNQSLRLYGARGTSKDGQWEYSVV